MVPTSSLLKQFNNIYRNNQDEKFTPTDLFTLAHYYGVSVQAMSLRLEEMDILPCGTYERLQAPGLKVREVQQKLG
ncbi:MAG: hypothetical protein F6K40_06155 [Okeania sp. SIO3I5]|uniref:hypothetical protein n=1 Tax=Okeania sp. SIO3I5 TaxID=2607805 RepID=UPI0013BD3C5E|nr:hypothetical protein [Okeania sp. SIO3I5]